MFSLPPSPPPITMDEDLNLWPSPSAEAHRGDRGDCAKDGDATAELGFALASSSAVTHSPASSTLLAMKTRRVIATAAGLMVPVGLESEAAAVEVGGRSTNRRGRDRAG